MVLNSDSLIQSFAPFLTTLISLFFAISVFRQYSQRRKIYQFIWGTGLLIISTLNADVASDKLNERTVGGSAMPANVRTISPFLTIPGSVALIGGALYSWYIARRSYNLFITIGALLVASGGGLSRFGMEGALYLFELLGVAVMYIGFIKSEDVM